MPDKLDQPVTLRQLLAALEHATYTREVVTDSRGPLSGDRKETLWLLDGNRLSRELQRIAR